MRQEEIQRARAIVDATGNGRRDLDAINEVLQTYLSRIADQLAAQRNEDPEEVLEQLDWQIEVLPSQVE